MTDHPLPLTRFTAEKHREALENLVERYSAVQEPVHYKEAALDDMNEATCSSCLRFFKDIGLIEAEKQGVYVPKDETIEYVSSKFDSESNTHSKLYNHLNNIDIIEEARFFLSRDEYEFNDLAEEIAQQEEGLEDENIDKIIRFLDIVDGINLLKSSNSPPVSNSKSETKEENDNTETKKQTSDTNSRPDLKDSFSVQELAKRAQPDQILEICEILKQGGTWSLEDIEDETEFNSNYVTGNLKLGEQLGFLNESESGVSLTDKGFELAFEGELNERSCRMFQEGLKKVDSYVALLEASLKKPPEDTSVIENTDLIRVMRTELGVRDQKESILKRKITVFFKTLEVAGFGEYKQASGTYPTRFKVGDTYSVTSIVDTLTEDTNNKGRKTDNSTDDKQTNGESDNNSSKDGGAKGEERKGEVAVELQEPQEQQADPQMIADGSTSEREVTTMANQNVEVNIEIELADLDSAELEAKLELIEQYLMSR